MQSTINEIRESQLGPDKILFLKSDGVSVVAASNEVYTSFVGIATNEGFNRNFNDEPVKLLITAVNNRTKERNYFQLLSKYLGNEITEDEFEKEIENNESIYVIDPSVNPTKSQLRNAAILSKSIIGIESIDDFMSLFSFSEESAVKLLDTSNE